MKLTKGMIVSALMYPSTVIIGTIGREYDNQFEIIRPDGASVGFTPKCMVRHASASEQTVFYEFKSPPDDSSDNLTS